MGGYLWRFVILDLVTDEALVEERWVPDTFEQIPDREHLWQVHGARFEALLAEHGVVRSEPGLYELPLSISETFFSVQTAGPVDEQVAISLHRTPDQQKQLGRLEHHDMQSLPQPLGLYLSPYEPRAGVLLGRLGPGFETSPAIVEYHLLGAHLETGFREAGR